MRSRGDRRRSAKFPTDGAVCAAAASVILLAVCLPVWNAGVTAQAQHDTRPLPLQYNADPGFQPTDRLSRQRRQPPLSSLAFMAFISQDKRELCSNPLRFSDHRMESFCRVNSPVADKLHEGLRRGYRLCQVMHKRQRWNCTFRHRFLDSGYPESGFVWALTTSSAVMELLLACKTAKFRDHCSCLRRGELETTSSTRPKRSVEPELTHSSLREFYGRAADSVRQMCDDNLPQAVAWVRNFFGDEWRKTDRLSLLQAVNMHNRRLGTIAVRRSLERKCSCVGMSGSCSTKICTRTVGSPKRVEDFLLKALRRAKQAVQKAPTTAPRRRTRQRRKNRKRQTSGLLFRRGERLRPLQRKRLAYTTVSDSRYCRPDTFNGLFGVGDRKCNAANSSAGDFCPSLCCGQGNYRAHQVTVHKYENCRMSKNPIRVVCDTRASQDIEYRCRRFSDFD